MIGIIISFYFFPIGFTFLPSSINTKMLLALMGIVFLVYECIKKESVILNRKLVMPIAIAAVFSLICAISTDINNTRDYSYANYIFSFLVWISGAYAVCVAMKWVHGEASFRLLTYYLAGICFSQCILALLINNIPAFQIFVDSIVSQGQEFFQEVDRLYGIGAALDSAGVRFSLVLVMIVALLNNDQFTRSNSVAIILLLLSFFTIAVIGNAISRTTIIGLGCAVAYFLFSSGLLSLFIKRESVKLGVWFGGFMLLAVFISVYMYNYSHDFNKLMRFAFEGFFNWVEKGEWTTSSTQKLSREMWIWPEDQSTWLIGSGLFDNFVYSTDIGYCRFVLYCGLIGFSVFAILFVYLGAFFLFEVYEYRLMFFIFIVLTFVIWLKVATDIFFIYALFFCLDSFVEKTPKPKLVDENRL
ncbi:hypothetical protein [Elizabethkingia argenteiflava]|nr:hypothetical protein [Elizabethkingia argenteiflava]